MPLVLVIDDEPEIRNLARLVLEDAGHEVLESPNGKIGHQLFRQRRPDLVIVDLFMPEKEGIETIREIRAVEPRAKIIAISGGGRYGFSDLLASVVHLGATTTLAKPFRRRELLAAVQEVMT
jgi:two-component system chemotaxis response regulator CheY